MRIGSGAEKGRRIRAKAGAQTRPTTAKVRKAIFDTLFGKFELEGSRVLDLYAGTGSLGLEAASRGAASVVFVESDRRAAEELRKAAGELRDRLECRLEVVTGDAMAYLARQSEPADLCLCDPPYSFDAWGDLLAKHPAGLVVAESNRELPESGGYRRTTLKRYGDTWVSFFVLNEDAPEAGIQKEDR
ncbi:MAG: RsmD family RNA methyltransferase [Actinomycetota bacterium]|nr:RsmD family RNA methyltransferase [Actinomycetota bacterium]MDA8210030.1 RsmD family RNA methyltransferase [Actinomycetota bacterium]